MASKNVKLSGSYMKAEADHIKKESKMLLKNINKDGDPAREAIKKKIMDKQHKFFKMCKEKGLHMK